jgi:site-specific recombinase XerD
MTDTPANVPAPIPESSPALGRPAHGLGPVADDWQAIQIWLDVLRNRPVSSDTLETYARETRRIQWYCATQGAPAPSTWSLQDALAYVAFLKSRSAEFACAPGLRPGQEGWTPFRGPLSDGAVADARKILSILFDFWRDMGYVRQNPFRPLRPPGGRRTANPARYALPPAAQNFVFGAMDDAKRRVVSDHLTYHRDRFVLRLLLRTGIRAHEAAAADMGDIEPWSDPENHRVYWALRLRKQKGGGQRLVFLDRTVMEDLQRYRLAFSLQAMPAAGDGLGLILSPRTVAAGDRHSARSRRHNARWRAVRTRQGVYNIVKDRLRAGAEAAKANGDVGAAGLLERASTHWMRHTRGTEVLLRTGNLRLAADALGQRDINTTMVYTNLDFLQVARALDD